MRLRHLMGFLPREARRNLLFCLCFVVSTLVFFYFGYLEHLSSEHLKKKSAMKIKDTTFQKQYQEKKGTKVNNSQLNFLSREVKEKIETSKESIVEQPGDVEIQNAETGQMTSVDQSTELSVIRILSWTSKFGYKPEWYVEGRHPFKKCDLDPGVTCEYTADKERLMDSDVLLIRGRRIKDGTTMPPKRPPHQKWLFYESEPPTKTWSYLPRLDPDQVRHVFNLTSTFTQDSDVPARSAIKCVLDDAKYKQLEGVDFAQVKTKGIAWFVSHCNTQSRREDYVTELKKFINVDVFGACGTLSCNDVQHGTRHAIKMDEIMECDRLVLNVTYKFYLAFENSLCEEYVTEKLTRILLQPINIIPVVLGNENYTNLMPVGSFIDVRDFESPQKLAKYLEKVDKDDNLYNSYIQKKMALDCSPPRDIPYECRLCSFLHAHKGETQVVRDVVDYWGPETKCLTPQQFYTGIADNVVKALNARNI